MEFKRLSDVEVVAEPTESANVLIEENGVIKKAPKTAVGGGNTEWDAVIDCVDAFETLDNYTFESGSYDTIKAKWDEGELPRVMLKYVQNYGDDYYNRVPSGRMVYYSSGQIMINFLLGSYSNVGDKVLRLVINTDSTFAVVESFDLR